MTLVDLRAKDWNLYLRREFVELHCVFESAIDPFQNAKVGVVFEGISVLSPHIVYRVILIPVAGNLYGPENL